MNTGSFICFIFTYQCYRFMRIITIYITEAYGQHLLTLSLHTDNTCKVCIEQYRLRKPFRKR